MTESPDFMNYDAKGQPTGMANVDELNQEARTFAAIIVGCAGADFTTIMSIIEDATEDSPDNLQIAKLAAALAIVSEVLGMELRPVEDALGGQEMRNSYIGTILTGEPVIAPSHDQFSDTNALEQLARHVAAQIVQRAGSSHDAIDYVLTHEMVGAGAARNVMVMSEVIKHLADTRGTILRPEEHAAQLRRYEQVERLMSTMEG